MRKWSYTLCFLISAFLVFSVQPMLGKALLPFFGGTPMVWSTTLLFFQVLLLAGYAYSHGIVSRFTVRVQIRIHSTLLLVSAALLFWAWRFGNGPLIPGLEHPSTAGSPISQILIALSLAVGLPYLALSGTSSLLQAWAARLTPDNPPYRYYAVSNTGSLLALLIYPLAIEVFLPLESQARAWTFLFVLFAALMTVVALQTARQSPDATHRSAPSKKRSQKKTQGHRGEKRSQKKTRVHRGEVFLWCALPACASVMLLATTNQMSQDIAVVPFLWVIPLSLYLLTFILCFGHPGLYGRWMILLLFAATLVHGGAMIQREHLHILAQLAAHGAVLFVTCLVCHGELVRLQPQSERLTQFYLAVALGGALGGLFVVFVAPRIFSMLYEVTFGIASSWFLLGAAWLRDKRSPMYIKRFSMGASLVIALALVSLAMITMVYVRSLQTARFETHRNFFGSLSVSYASASTNGRPIYELGHGFTAHGIQIATPKERPRPTAYYGMESGVGRVLESYPRRDGTGLSIGVVGLGVGTLAAYGAAGDHFSFYEVNPDVVSYAKGQGGYFSFLRDTKADYSVAIGDARVSLLKEIAKDTQKPFDILILDAFLGHAIPVHLLTVECFDLYLKRTRPEGVILVHIGNPHVDLEPQLSQIAAHFGLKSALFESRGDGRVTYDAVWVALTRDDALLTLPPIAPHHRVLERIEDRSVWTDGYSNLLEALR